MPKILLVEDDLSLARETTDYLKAKLLTVDAVHDLATARDFVFSSRCDLIVLDWNLPDGTGLELLREIRGRGMKTRVLMLTQRDNIECKEIGFTSGADDYLTKPFHPKELLLRIDSLLKRPELQLANEFKAADVTIDLASRTVSRNGREIALSSMEYCLLEFFVRHPNQVFSTDSLLERVWKSDTESSTGTVVTTIARLRKKIGRGFPIKNIFGVGYKLSRDDA